MNMIQPASPQPWTKRLSSRDRRQKKMTLKSQVQVVYGFVGHGIRCDKTTAKDILKSRHEILDL